MVQVREGSATDLEEVLELTDLLRAELVELDVAEVVPVGTSPAPEDAKGISALVGMLALRLGSAEALRAVLAAVRSWAQRSQREVEVSYGGEVLKVTGATAEQQDRIIDAWLARHASGS
jgi:hypothetical protein